MIVVKEEELLLVFLKIENICFLGIGELLFVNIDEWVNVVDFEIGKKGCREMNIML